MTNIDKKLERINKQIGFLIALKEFENILKEEKEYSKIVEMFRDLHEENIDEYYKRSFNN